MDFLTDGPETPRDDARSDDARGASLAPPPEHAPPPGWGAPSSPTYPMYPTYLAADARGIRPPASDRDEATGPLPRQPAAKGRAKGAAAGTLLLAALSKLALVAKVLAPLLSAIVSLGAYALLFGWQFGLGILALLFVHEMGHFVVIRAKGLPASLPIFIPLVGAYVAMRKMPANVRDEAEIAIAGPLVGALGGVACFVAYQLTGSGLWLGMAYFSFLINLLNLIPVSPLDGGRIVGAISRWFLPVGLVLVLVAFFYTHNILLLILLWLGGTQTLSRFGAAARRAPYYAIPFLARAYVTLLYFGLAGGLALGMVAAQQALAGSAPF